MATKKTTKTKVEEVKVEAPKVETPAVSAPAPIPSEQDKMSYGQRP